LAVLSNESVKTAGRAINPKWFGKWADNTVPGKIKSRGTVSRAGQINDPGVIKFLNNKGIKLETLNISITGHKLARMVRGSKTGRGANIPVEMFKNIPNIIKNKRAAMWYKKNQKLIYVFDVPGNTNKGKFTIAVDVKRKINRF